MDDLFVVGDGDDRHASDAVLARPDPLELPLPDHLGAGVDDGQGEDGWDGRRRERVRDVRLFGVFDDRAELQVR